MFDNHAPVRFRLSKSHPSHPVGEFDISEAYQADPEPDVIRCVVSVMGGDLSGSRPDEPDRMMPTVPESMTPSAAVRKWATWLWEAVGFEIPTEVAASLGGRELDHLKALAGSKLLGTTFAPWTVSPGPEWPSLPDEGREFSRMSVLGRILALASEGSVVMARTLVSRRDHLSIQRSAMVADAEVENRWRGTFEALGSPWDQPWMEPVRLSLRNVGEDMEDYYDREARRLLVSGWLPVSVDPRIPDDVREALTGPRWLSVAEAARLLGTTQDAVRMAISRGRLDATKEGRVLRLRAADVARYGAAYGRKVRDA